MNSLECGCSWHFAKQQDACQDVGPNNAVEEHFSTTPYPSLIRESIQNSLDAVLDKERPVVVEFQFGNLRLNTFKGFQELREHIQGVSALYKDKAKPRYDDMAKCFSHFVNDQRSIGYIKVSDYNTKGMDYKPDSSPFHAFVRAVGLTVKDDCTSGGSFGFGKAAYFMMSPIRTVLVSTMTSEGKRFFEGAASLCTHLYRDENGDCVKYQHYGFYDNQDGRGPVSSKDDIPSKFCREEVGTDIYIMGTSIKEEDKEIAYDEMIKAALRHFWMAFLHNKLEVAIGNVRINQSNVDDFMKELFPNMLDKSRSGENYNPRPYYEAVTKANTSKDFMQFDSNLPKLGRVSLFLWKNQDVSGKVIHIRKQRMFIFREKSYTRSFGYHAVFLCTNNQGNQLLQSIEDPSHKKWEPKRNKIAGKDIMDNITEFVQRCIQEAFTSDNDETLGIEGLEDYLFIPEEIIANDKDDLKDNPFFGEPSDNQQEEGTSPIAMLDPNDLHLDKSGNEVLGNVVTIRSNKGKECQSTGDLGGHKRKSNKSKQKGHGNSPDSSAYSSSSADDDSEDARFLENVPVKYRVMAETRNHTMIHTIVINSDYNVERGQIEIIVSGEDKDEPVDIKSSSMGTVSGNIISNLRLSSLHKNIIEIEFADKMRHAIKLTAYEFK